MRYAISLLLALATVPAWAQIKIDEEYGRYQPVEWSLSVPDADAKALWEVRPLSGQSEFTTRTYGDVTAFWGEPGKYQVTATVVVVDFDAREFDVKRFVEVFTILGNVEPDDGDDDDVTPPTPPDPQLPADQFDDLARRIDAIAKEKGVGTEVRKKLAAEFFEVSRLLSSGEILRISDAAKRIEDAESGVDWDAGSKAMRNVYVADGMERTPMGLEEAAEWYNVVGLGLNGGE